MSLVIKEWRASETPDQNGEYIHIHGRESGLLSFLFSLLGISPTTRLVVDRTSVRFQKGSFSGLRLTVTPLSHISSASFGYEKPWKSALVVAGILGVLLTPLPIIGWLIAAVLGIAYYSLNKVLFINYLVAGSGGFGVLRDFGTISFKRSVIEGQSVDEKAGARIVAVIEMLILGKDKPRDLDSLSDEPASLSEVADHAKGELIAVAEHARQRSDGLAAQARDMIGRTAAKVSASVAAPAAVVVAADPAPARCPECGAEVSDDNAFCSGCGRKLK